MKFKDILNNDKIFLYCGDISKQRRDYTNIQSPTLVITKLNYD